MSGQFAHGQGKAAEWEWYIILTLWSPLQVIKLLEDSSEQATGVEVSFVAAARWLLPPQSRSADMR
jgi:hypothetical protein